MGVRGANSLIADGYRITYANGKHQDFTPDDMIHIADYNALDPRVGVSKMEALRQILIESATRRAASSSLTGPAAAAEASLNAPSRPRHLTTTAERPSRV